QSLAVQVGGTATLTVAAQGTDPLAYEWRFNNGAISGATRSSLVLSNVQSPNAGDYSVQASNTVGVVVSSNATLTVAAAPPPVTTLSGLIEFSALSSGS